MEWPINPLKSNQKTYRTKKHIKTCRNRRSGLPPATCTPLSPFHPSGFRLQRQPLVVKPENLGVERRREPGRIKALIQRAIILWICYFKTKKNDAFSGFLGLVRSAFGRIKYFHKTTELARLGLLEMRFEMIGRRLTIWFLQNNLLKTITMLCLSTSKALLLGHVAKEVVYIHHQNPPRCIRVIFLGECFSKRKI